MSNGNIDEFLSNEPDVDRVALVSGSNARLVYTLTYQFADN